MRPSGLLPPDTVVQRGPVAPLPDAGPKLPACSSLPCAPPKPTLPPTIPLQNEVVSILQQQAKIEPGFTQLVWQKLEEQNTEFFR